MSRLVGQGAYGCVFSPGMKCLDPSEPTPDTVSKLQKNGFSARNEIKIGRLVSALRTHKMFFLPASTSCPVDLRALDAEAVEDCKLVDDESLDSRFLLLEIPKIENSSLTEALGVGRGLPRFIECYSHLLKGLALLQTKAIVHFDIKADNVLFGLRLEAPLLIDFGLSIPIRELDESNRQRYFYTYVPEYAVWPLEVHVLNYMLHVEKGALTKSGLTSVCERVAAAQPFIKGDVERRAYKAKCFRAMKPQVGEPLDVVFPRLVSKWATWDNYALGIMFAEYLRLATPETADNNVLLRGIGEILKDTMDPDPRGRPSVAETSKRLRDVTLRGRGHADAMRLYRGTDIRDPASPSP